MLVKKMTVDIDPVQEGSGDPSPGNVRPISGWDSAEVTQSGENLCNPDDFVQGTISSVTGGISSSSSRIASDFVPVEENSKYFLIVDDDKYVFEIAGYGNNRTFINLFTSVNATSGVITTPANCEWIRFTVRKPDNSAINPSAIQKAGVIKSAVSVPYIPYQGSEIEYEFPQAAKPVYGAKLTIWQDGSGELVAKRVKATGLSWVFNAGSSAFTTNSLSSVIKKPASNSDVANVICENYKTVSTNDGYNSSELVCFCNVNGALYIRTGNSTDTPSGDIVYELATPVTYQLTNQQVIALLKGSNNIWADTGDVAVEYPADTKLYIDGKVAELQALILENISNS
jgi:hypothetical protein